MKGWTELTKENAELRRLLWLRHGCLNGSNKDDKEMKCSCGINFATDSPEKMAGFFYTKTCNDLFCMVSQEV